MKSTSVLLSTYLILLGLLMTSALASDETCGCCGGGPLAPNATVIAIQVNAKALPHQLASLTARTVKIVAHHAARAPHRLAKQLQIGSNKTQVVYRAATGQTQGTFQRISAGVTSLSLQLIRGACSYFWALLSGLLR